MSPELTRSAKVLHALSSLRDRGLRATTARRLVLEALDRAPGPVSVAQIASGLGGRFPRSDIGSVYRVLETFEALGIVRRVHLGGGAALYALRSADEPEYLLCERCGATQAVDSRLLDDVRGQIRARFGLTPRFSSYPVAGVCRRCAAGERDAAQGPGGVSRADAARLPAAA
jgi:Fur family transcriptional regulator, ferric uptake regulator